MERGTGVWIALVILVHFAAFLAWVLFIYLALKEFGI